MKWFYKNNLVDYDWFLSQDDETHFFVNVKNELFTRNVTMYIIAAKYRHVVYRMLEGTYIS